MKAEYIDFMSKKLWLPIHLVIPFICDNVVEVISDLDLMIDVILLHEKFNFNHEKRITLLLLS